MQKDEKQCKEKPFPSIHLQAIDDIINKEGYTKYEVSKRIIATDGGNYTSDLYEVNINGETASGNEETNIFIKTMKPSRDNNSFSVTKCYFKEHYAYTELKNIFADLQNDAKIPVHERFNMPKSYDATNTEVVFLENLKQKGFTTLHRMDIMPLKFGESAVKELAKFHGLFYVLQKKSPEYFDIYLRNHKSNLIVSDETKQFILNLSHITIKGLDDVTKEKVKKFMTIMYEKYNSYVEDTTSQGCTICHGDYIPPNILMKQTNSQTIEVVPVDFQTYYYGCPINDFITLMFYASDQEFRRNHLTDLKNLYYDYLNKFLGYFDIDLHKLFPRSEFERQYTERLDLGLISALFSIPFQFVKNDHIPDIMQDDLSKLDFPLDSQYGQRIQGIVDDFINWGYL